MRGRIDGFRRGAFGVNYVTIATKEDVAELCDSLKNDDCDIEISKHHDKRTNEANAYMWELCTKIADKLTDDGKLTTKEDIYRETVRNAGVFKDIPMLVQGADTLRAAWERHGTGWVTEQVDYLKGADGYMVRCYYGTSVYNRKQMSCVIDNLVQDCDALGIDHRTPAEINNMLSLWEQEPRKGGG